MHLAVAPDGAGWHPAAWREPRARPAELFSARYWTDLITEAERGLLDFVTIEDGFTVQSSLGGAAAGLRRAGARHPRAASYHVSPATVLEAVAGYRAAFRPGHLDQPYVSVSADVVVALAGHLERLRDATAPTS